MVQEKLHNEDVFVDIDETLIDVDWKSKPMLPWEQVYDSLCREVGKHYGLTDIREAI